MVVASSQDCRPALSKFQVKLESTDLYQDAFLKNFVIFILYPENDPDLSKTLFTSIFGQAISTQKLRKKSSLLVELSQSQADKQANEDNLKHNFLGEVVMGFIIYLMLFASYPRCYLLIFTY